MKNFILNAIVMAWQFQYISLSKTLKITCKFQEALIIACEEKWALLTLMILERCEINKYHLQMIINYLMIKNPFFGLPEIFWSLTYCVVIVFCVWKNIVCIFFGILQVLALLMVYGFSNVSGSLAIVSMTKLAFSIKTFIRNLIARCKISSTSIDQRSP